MNIYKHPKLKNIVGAILGILGIVLVFLAIFIFKKDLTKLMCYGVSLVLVLGAVALFSIDYCPYCHYYNFRTRHFKCRCRNCGTPLKDDPDYKWRILFEEIFNDD